MVKKIPNINVYHIGGDHFYINETPIIDELRKSLELAMKSINENFLWYKIIALRPLWFWLVS